MLTKNLFYELFFNPNMNVSFLPVTLIKDLESLTFSIHLMEGCRDRLIWGFHIDTVFYLLQIESHFDLQFIVSLKQGSVVMRRGYALNNKQTNR